MLPVSQARLGISAYVWIGPYTHSHHYPGYIYFLLLHSEACWWKPWQTLASQCRWVHSTFDLNVVALWKCNTVKEMSLVSGLCIIARMCTRSLAPHTPIMLAIASFWQWWKNFRGVLSKAEPQTRKFFTQNLWCSLGKVSILFCSSVPSSAGDCLSKTQDVYWASSECYLLHSIFTDMFQPK